MKDDDDDGEEPFDLESIFSVLARLPRPETRMARAAVLGCLAGADLMSRAGATGRLADRVATLGRYVTSTNEGWAAHWQRYGLAMAGQVTEPLEWARAIQSIEATEMAREEALEFAADAVATRASGSSFDEVYMAVALVDALFERDRAELLLLESAMNDLNELAGSALIEPRYVITYMSASSPFDSAMWYFIKGQLKEPNIASGERYSIQAYRAMLAWRLDNLALLAHRSGIICSSTRAWETARTSLGINQTSDRVSRAAREASSKGAGPSLLRDFDADMEPLSHISTDDVHEGLKSWIEFSNEMNDDVFETVMRTRFHVLV
ncbi:hypothetical protein [Sphingosinicella sp. BN140058]|uniref:hypothetical protein n=1 Tax=Sphingosinicella sp. BN140058 TaxID=1892855 RepID=UPI00101024CD|nr:hypothetical protein [Sphingosinicella sp. BN140058]QAY80401.1 hypothetical protein ETR14_27560 [Sphingosinicella sp. BN140058]